MKYRISLIFIIILAAFLRFYKLGSVPVGLHRDEAFLGYNAYSLLKTGREMSGDLLPIHFRSFLYSPGGYSYLAIPGVAIFDLNAFSTRFPSAFFGTLTVVVFYFLTKKLSTNNYLLSTSATLFVTVNPWHINLSRTATENTVVLFFVICGTYFYLSWLKNQKLIPLLFGILVFSCTLFIYQAPRAFVPLLLILLPISYWQSLPLRKRLTAFLPALVSLIIVGLIFISPTRGLRFQTVSIFGNGRTQLILDEQLREDGISRIDIYLSRLFHNKPLAYLTTFSQNYFAHWNYDFLFSDRGLPDRYRVPNVGLLLPIEILLIPLGFWTISRKNKSLTFVLLGWILIGPIGSALAFDDVPNLQRTLLTYPPLALFSAYGLVFMLSKINQLRLKYFLNTILVSVFVLQLSAYVHAYYIHQIVHHPWYRHEGYEKLITEVNQLKDKYEKIIVTNHESAPGIFFLFYNRFDPVKFITDNQSKQLLNFDRVNFAKYEFPEDPCPLKTAIDQLTGKITTTGKLGVLYVNFATCEIPKKARLIKEINRNDNSTVFRLLDLTNPL